MGIALFYFMSGYWASASDHRLFYLLGSEIQNKGVRSYV